MEEVKEKKEVTEDEEEAGTSVLLSRSWQAVRGEWWLFDEFHLPLSFVVRLVAGRVPIAGNTFTSRCKSDMYNNCTSPSLRTQS